MIYLSILFNLFLFYLFLKESYLRHLEKQMLKQINIANQKFDRYQYYEKRDYVFANIKVSFFISNYQLRQIYENLIHLYPSFPFIL